MLLIRACVCYVVCHTVDGSGGDDQFHQYDLHPELHRGTGRTGHSSQLASIPVTFLYNNTMSEQMASYFGYSLAVADLNGDG